MSKLLWIAVLCLAAMPCRAEPQYDFPAAAADDPATLAKAMPVLAEAVLKEQQDADTALALDARFRLQMVSGRYAETAESVAALRALRTEPVSPQSGIVDLQYEIYARAKTDQVMDESGFDAALQKVFRAALAQLDDRSAALLMRALNVEPAANGSLVVDYSAMQRDLQSALQSTKGKTRIGLGEALALVRAYQVEEAYKEMMPLLPPLIAEDDAHRYRIDRDVQVKTPDGATVCVLVVRPRSATAKLPALLEFTIYADAATNLSEARRSASNGYAGVAGLSRGKGCSPDQPVPFEHDGTDADAVIDWIAAQPWSDGRVGMFGGSYDGFTQWAAAKHAPKALKALMPSVTACPGVDVPMEGNVFQTFSYYWPLYVDAGRGLDASYLNDFRRWNKLYRDWYLSGKPYRDMQSLDKESNPVWQRWLDHPAYDAYWQSMVPYGDEFAKIGIPVLTTTGYYDGGQIGALYYYQEHHKHRPKAEHYLLIGPYDHIRGQRGTVGVLGEDRDSLWGYDYDPAAHIDLGELRYQWFDYVFKGGKKPPILQDKVNYEVMGADHWAHAASLDAMGRRKLRFHLGARRAGDNYRLSPMPPKDHAAVTQTLDLKDRSDVDRSVPGGNIVDKDLDTWNSLVYVSEPLKTSMDLSGLFDGRLDFQTNKRDFDLGIELFEVLPDGRYFELSWYLQRMSFMQDRRQRQLLTPGRRQTLGFQNSRLTSRRLQKGSRLLVMLSLIRQPNAEIDYGSGKDVADESMADAGDPLSIQWFDDSYIEVPVTP